MDEANGAVMKTVDDVIGDIGFGRFQVAVIVLCGLVQASDMLEIQYVSMMSQKLQCTWWISDYWKSLITAATFVGLFVGAYLWGPLGDKHCRRSITTVCMGFVLFYGCMTALAPNIVWVVILRFLVGTGIGGVQPVSAALLTEFMPAETRGLAWFLFQSLWCIGGVLEIGMAWLLLDMTHGWRYLAVLTALPMLLLALPWTLWMPRSPRQSLLQGRLADTRKTLDRMADLNRQPRYVGEFLVGDLQGKFKKGSIPQLLVPETYLRQTLQLAIIVFASGFSYYGLILLNVQVPVLLRDRCPLGAGNATLGQDWASGLDRTCHSCIAFNYVELLVPTFADMLSSLLNGFLIERLLGRRALMAVYFCVAAVLMPLLSFCMASGARIALFFIIRFFISSGYSFVGLYVLEAYPTTLRTTAAGFHSSFARIASIVVPFVAQVFIVRVSLLGGLFIFTGLLAAATVSVILLPLETKDQPLSQTVVTALVGDPVAQSDGVGDDEKTAVLRAAAADEDKGAGTGGGAASYGSVSPKTD